MAKDWVKCHATSSFSIEGEHVENGSNLEVPDEIYKELRSAQRVEPGHVEQPKKRGKGEKEADGANPSPPPPPPPGQPT